LLHELGRTGDAQERFAAEVATDFEFPYDSAWLDGMENLLDAATRIGDSAAARVLIDRVGPFATQVISAAPALVKGAIARPLAAAATVTGDYDQAEEWFATAHDIHQRLEAPFWMALGQLDHADLCLARRADGDLDRARELATTAAATAAEYSCAGLTKRAEQLLNHL
jgi:tetratricopeptide (TPR) repeat protein